ncbi:MAG TPA: branched-chain amino acid ABC transporter permease [Ilumatobacteraceae bacterium]|nr:branched-chain amino acid ABC transporter permease [Ilumatobacteraceae bacterium]
MALFLQRFVDGLSEGSVYALIALGLVIIYRGTGHLNFAQGEMALFCTYCVYQFGEWGIPVLPAVMLGMVVGFVIGAATEVALVRPVARKSLFAVFIVTIGLFQFLNWLDGAIWGGQQLPSSAMGSKQQKFPSLFPNESDDFFKVFGAAIRWQSLGVLVLVLGITGLLFLLFNHTKLGLAMRAVASNPDSAKLVGIRVGTVLMVSWGIAAAVGALGGAVYASSTNAGGAVSQGLMFSVFIYGSAAATLGGFDSPGGAVVGGLTIGLVQNMVAGYADEWVGQAMKVGVAFLVILAVLLARPSGLFGTSKVERV